MLDDDSPGVTTQRKLERCSYRDATIVSSYLAETEDTSMITLQYLYRSEDGDTTSVDEQLLLKFCQHIASGMSYLAGKSFIHRDLAARNILVSKDKTCKV